MHSPSPFRAAACGLVLLGAAISGRAQTASQPTAEPASRNERDDVVTLQAFNVTGDAAHGYVASESTTGTRIASKIQDLPFAANVVTADFLNDLQAFNINDQLASISGFSPSEVTGQFQLRGFQAPTTLVDGFRRIGLVDTVDIDRIEVIKGAVASIYGQTQPGGVVNYITRQPTTTRKDHIEFGAGSDGFLRGALYTSGPLGSSGKLFYRVDLADQTNKYAQEFASNHKSYISGKLLYKLSDATSITADLEHSEVYEHPFVQVLTVTEKQTMPWAGNDITESQYYGMATKGLLNYNYAGPESYIHQRVTSGTLKFEHRFSDFWSIKLGVNAFTNPDNEQSVGSGAYYPYGTGNVTVTNGVVQNAFTPMVKDQPQATWRPQRGGGGQLDNLFSFSTGPINNKLLVTADYYEVSQRTLSLVPTVNGSQATDYYALYSPYDPSGASYYTMQSTWSPALGYGWNTTLYGTNPALYNGVSTDQWVASGDYGIFASERASLFHDKLTFLVGGRGDQVRNQVKNYNLPADGTNGSLTSEPAAYQAFDYNTSAWTYQLGVSYAVTNGLNLYANKSSAFNPQPQIDSYTGQSLPNNKSNGEEFGVKLTLLNNRLTFTADRFNIREANVVQNETDAVSGLRETILVDEERAKGYEFDGSFQATNRLYFQADWGYTDAKVTKSSALTFLQGLPARRVPRDNVFLMAKYQLPFLKGLYVMGDMKYYSKSLVNLGSGKALIPGPAGSKDGSTGKMYYVPSTNLVYTLADPKIAGEKSITTTPVVNVPFPGNGLLPYPNLPAGTLVTFPMSSTGQPLPLANASVPGVYSGVPSDVFVDDGRQNNFNAPFAVFDVGLGYDWRLNHVSNAVRLSVKNVLNRKYTWGSGAAGLPFQVVGTYSINF